MKQIETETTKEILKKISNANEFDEYLKKIENTTLDWRDFFDNKIKEFGMDTMQAYKHIAKECGVSVDTVRKHWKCKFPDKRLCAIFLGLTFHLSLDEIDNMLSHYGMQPHLYSKNISDAICIYLVKTKSYALSTPICMQYEEMKKKILEMYDKNRLEDVLNIHINTRSKNNTQVVRKHLIETKDKKSFYKYIASNLSDFKSANEKLYQYIEEYMNENDYTLNTVSKYELLKPSFGAKYSHLKEICKCPSRNDLIALGIALHMTIDELNRLLNIAHMGELYPKDRVEAAIIFVICDIKENFPDIFNNDYDENFDIQDKDIMTYLNYRKARPTEYITPQDPEMMSYIRQAIYNIDVELWEDTKKFLDIII